MPCLNVGGICRLTRDAEVFKSKNASFVHFGIATFRKNVQGGRQDVDYFDAEYYLKDQSSQLPKYMTKGRMIFLDRAELRNNKYTGTDGQQRSKIKIFVFNFEFLDSGKDKPPVVVEKSKAKEELEKSAKVVGHTRQPSAEGKPTIISAGNLPEEEIVPF